MPTRIKNKSKQLITVPLNSGSSLHLVPGELSPPIEDYEIADNHKISKLTSSRVITTAKVIQGRPARTAKRAEKKDK
jgi:hypothetical protein